MANLTLWDLATLRRNDPYTGLIEDVTTLAPEFSTIAAVPREGTWYEIVSRTSLPSGGFRRVNSGQTPAKSAYKKQVKEMFFLDYIINMDEAIVKGDDSSVGAVWQLEAAGAMRSAAIDIGEQTWYGTSADTYGFQGVRAQCAGSIGAGGSTSSTSAYLLWMDAQQGCRYDVGRDGSFAISSPLRQQIADASDATKSLFAFVGNLSAYVGFTVGSAYSTWAVTGIDTTSSNGVYTRALTDRLAAQLMSNIPTVRRNNMRWFMNRTTHFLLQQSRTTIIPGSGGGVAGNYQAASATGAPAWSPRPTELEGFPVTITDSITNTESN